MGKTFADHFGTVAAHYAEARPKYPPELFAWLASQAPGHTLAWDCGAGSGQASTELAKYFQRVIATDASAGQISQAVPCPNVEYRVAPAEQSGPADASADVVVIAQALHWFDFERFFAEVKRVLKPGGLIAAWSYGVLKVEGEEVNALIQDFYSNKVSSYWPPERRHVETGYRLIEFPFARIEAPHFDMVTDWSLQQLLDYLRSWSATAKFIEVKGFDPVAVLEKELAARWGEAERRRKIEWPLTVLAGLTPAHQ